MCTRPDIIKHVLFIKADILLLALGLFLFGIETVGLLEKLITEAVGELSFINL